MVHSKGVSYDTQKDRDGSRQDGTRKGEMKVGRERQRRTTASPQEIEELRLGPGIVPEPHRLISVIVPREY